MCKFICINDWLPFGSVVPFGSVAVVVVVVIAVAVIFWMFVLTKTMCVPHSHEPKVSLQTTTRD